MKIQTRAAFAALLLTAACGRSESGDTSTPPAAPPAAPAAPPSGSIAGMRGMGTETEGMMAEMRTHLQTMHGARGDSLKAMLPTHRQTAANLIAQMNREMRQMNMPADPAWTATVDSLRQDLVRMPEMGAAELQSAMPAHAARLGRLMRMHRSMTDDAKP